MRLAGFVAVALDPRARPKPHDVGLPGVADLEKVAQTPTKHAGAGFN